MINDEYGHDMESAPHPKQRITVKLQESTDLLKPGMILRYIEEK